MIDVEAENVKSGDRDGMLHFDGFDDIVACLLASRADASSVIKPSLIARLAASLTPLIKRFAADDVLRNQMSLLRQGKSDSLELAIGSSNDGIVRELLKARADIALRPDLLGQAIAAGWRYGDVVRVLGGSSASGQQGSARQEARRGGGGGPGFHKNLIYN